MDNRYDGDQLNFTLPLDTWSAEKLGNMAPHMSVFSTMSPETLSEIMTISKPVIGNIANWIDKITTDEPDPEKVKATASLYD